MRRRPDCPQFSHRLSVSDSFVAVIALVLLIVTRRDAEGDEAAAEPAPDEAEDEAEDPGEGSLHLLHVSHASVLAELARHRHGVFGPVARWVGTAMSVDNHDLLTGSHHGLTRGHHGLTRGHHGLTGSHHGLTRHGLALHGLTRGHHWLLGSILGLSLHGLGSVHRRLLLLEHWLSFSDGMAGHRVRVVHLLCIHFNRSIDSK